MFRHFFRTAVRALIKEKGYSVINVTSLALGLAASILILAYVRFEFSYDRYHEKKDRLYRLVTALDNTSYDGIAKVNGPWGPAAREAIPEIEAVTRFVFVGQTLLANNDIRDYESLGLYADPDIFKMFSFRMLKGDPVTALTEPNTIVLSSDLADKYFHNENALGKTLLLDNDRSLQVTGIMENVPANSHFTFNFLLSMATLNHPQKDDWVAWNQFYTYVLLREGADPDAFGAKMSQALISNMGEKGKIYHPYLQPVTDIHLHSNLFREMSANSALIYPYLMSVTAIFLLVIGCVNFINISTARASKRAKEVGVRKVSGANRMSLCSQFLGESLMLSVLALMIAILLAKTFLPTFNQLTLRQFSIDWLGDPFLMTGLLSLTLLTAVLAGFYPAIFISSFQPAHILKNDKQMLRGAKFRRYLVIFQFSLSAFFLIGTAVVFQQLKYIQQKEHGFNEEQLVRIPIRSLDYDSETIKNMLLTHPSIQSVSATSNLPGGSDWGIPYVPVGVAEDEIPPARVFVGDHDMIPTLEIEMAVGRSFSGEIASDRTSAFIINQELARQLDWQNPLGERIAMPAISREAAPVIGVVKDFHFRSLHEEIAPALFFIPPQEWLSTFIVRIRPGQTVEALSFLEATFTEVDPSHPFTYRFFDEQFALLHAAEEQMARLLTITSAIAFVIACLGLFGLAAFSAEARTKEIGVRKVLGASVFGIVGLLTKDFLKLVTVANIIAWPVGYYAAEGWLAGYAYRADLSPGVFVWTILLSATIAILTVSFQAIRASTANPISALKYE